ncbi:hypothetical protein RF11_14434 [Thelohanellus kitauei]|uniref:Uncharacterized protein n=1 Tax=Thelohanellus kitauei TaxID=669202 RepID=A0A0C2MKS4_THEKT|nr:hypothetical protein RF11_14434 [Thelohanellus kitauei]
MVGHIFDFDKMQLKYSCKFGEDLDYRNYRIVFNVLPNTKFMLFFYFSVLRPSLTILNGIAIPQKLGICVSKCASFKDRFLATSSILFWVSLNVAYSQHLYIDTFFICSL